MRKKTAVAEIKLSLNEKLGINFESYRNPELNRRIANLIVFPQYAFKILALPIGIFMLLHLILAGFLYSNNGLWSSLIFLSLGVVFCLGNGTLYGIIRLLNVISKDVKSIFAESINITRIMLNDIKGRAENLKSDIQLPSLFDIVYGVLFVVIVPIVTDIAQRKIPIIGKWLSARIESIVTASLRGLEGILNNSKFIDKMVGSTEDKVSNCADTGNHLLDASVGKISDIIDGTCRKATKPIKIFFAFTSFIYFGLFCLIVLF
jgi:hypothetical protein